MPSYTVQGNKKVNQKSTSKLQFSDITSIIEGPDLGELKQIWQDIAASESRMNLMSALKGKKLGFREVENFSLGLRYSFKSDKLRDLKDRPIEGVLKAAMQVKMRDEKYHHRELTKLRKSKKLTLGKKLHPQTGKYKKVIRYLRQEAGETKRAHEEKYSKKIEHLENIYRDAGEDQYEPPPSMAYINHLSIFSQEKFCGIPEDEMEVPRIGEVLLSSDEVSLLRKSPKFAIPQRLLEDSLKEEMEKAYSLVRIELREEEAPDPQVKKEQNNPLNLGAGRPGEEEQNKDSKEDEARARQVYDPIRKEYDERRRRVTDLVECARVTLPKPLSIRREAEIELRREIHDRVYQEYRREHCTSNGEQESNLTSQERKGLESLQKRMKTENLIIMKTDKSGKLCVTTEQMYKEMGEVHVKEDKIIDRDKIREIDKTMNEHSIAWCNMWGTGRDHEQEDRVIQSKTSKGENRAKLYLAYKDHKKEKLKTRPIGTACSSNTRAFANSVSDFLEAVADSEEQKYEVISTEDLLHHIWLHNRRVKEKKSEAEEIKKDRWNCWIEKQWERTCLHCKEYKEDQSNEISKISKEEDHGPVTEILKAVIESSTDIAEARRARKECQECMEEIDLLNRQECSCGPAIRRTELAMVGMDAVALFPSMSGRKTAEIVRKRVVRSSLNLRGFNWRKALIYIRANMKLKIKISSTVRRFMPVRKKVQGVEPGMASKGLKGKEGSEGEQWYFPRSKPSEEVVKEIASIVAEIAIITLWDNYCYDFGGETRLQGKGGPIGQRPTMAASRIVIQDFFEDYHKILTKAGLEISLLKVYVDDGRQVTSLLRKGLRYSRDEKEFVWSKEAEEEDSEKEKEGEDRATFMARLCLPVMNDINPDLTFTAEVEKDFSNNKLPTLDTELWMQEDGTVRHGYFEKEMKSQLMLDKASAMSIKQKHCIQANELTRRLYNLDRNNEDLEEEIEKVIENFTRQCKNSGWSRKEVKEMVVNGHTGWLRRVKRREEEAGAQYRSAGKTLPSRTRKKLTGKEDWYKGGGEKRKRDEYDEEQEDSLKTRRRSKKVKNGDTTNPKNNVISVMFVPYTVGGELARRLREEESKLEDQTGYRIKIVERTGSRLVDLLHRSNPWQGEDCRRPGCLLCTTKTKTGKYLDQDCTKRCLVYETWCLTCERREEEKINMEEEDEQIRKEKKKAIRLHMYVGESSRSIYERGLEHIRDCQELKKESHMIKHYFDHHEEEELEDMEFGMRIARTTRTAFNRQILESVLIQSRKTKHNILNSKSEYNRCALPRLTAKLGEETYSKMEKAKKEEKLAEKELELKIRNLKVKQGKQRRGEASRSNQPAEKRRKLNSTEYKRVLQEESKGEKRKAAEDGVQGVKERTAAIPDMFQPKIRKEEKRKDEKEEIPIDNEDEEREVDWEEELKIRELRIIEEEDERVRRSQEEKNLAKSFELLNLCKQTLREEGETWQVSKERRELEKVKETERRERLARAGQKKADIMGKLKVREIQTTISQRLSEVPENKRKLIEARIEKERMMDLKEVKQKMWKKWRQNKGKKINYPKLEKGSTLEWEEKLKKIDIEVENYKTELENAKKEEAKKAEKKEKKRRKQSHWDMMKWIVQFIDENKEKWDRIKKQKKLDMKLELEKEEWIKKSKEEKIKLLQAEKLKKKTALKENKEIRLEEVLKMKENWKRREVIDKFIDNDEYYEAGEDKEEEKDDTKEEKEETEIKEEEKKEDLKEDQEENPFEGEEEIDPELIPDKEEIKVGEIEYLGPSSLCLECVFTPCLCTLLHIERKIASLIVIKDLMNEIVEEATVRKKVERKRKREEENSEDEAYKEKQVQVYKVDGHSECGSSHSLCPSQKFVQSERVPPAPNAGDAQSQKFVQGEQVPPAPNVGDAQSLSSTNGPYDPEKSVKNNKITQQRAKNRKTPEDNKQQVKIGQQETPTNPPSKNLSRLFELKLKQPRIQFRTTTEVEKTTDWLKMVTSNKKTTKTTTTAKAKLQDNQTTTTNNKIPEEQNKVIDNKPKPEIPEDNIPRLTVKLRQPQLQFGNKTTTIPALTDNTKKLKNNSKQANGKLTNAKAIRIKNQPSIEGYITTKRSKNNSQENTGTTTITTNNTKETTRPTKPTTTLDNTQQKQTTKAKSDNTSEQAKKTQIKPPDIDKLTPVSLKIKVRGTVVSDMKEFLARKKLEREKKYQVLPIDRADTITSGEKIIPTITKPNTGDTVTRQIVGHKVKTVEQCSEVVK